MLMRCTYIQEEPTDASSSVADEEDYEI
jgi:hypothetical protein